MELEFYILEDTYLCSSFIATGFLFLRKTSNGFDVLNRKSPFEHIGLVVSDVFVPKATVTPNYVALLTLP